MEDNIKSRGSRLAGFFFFFSFLVGNLNYSV